MLRLLQLTPSADFIDMGANIGAVSLPLMAALKPKRKFIAAEPNPENIDALLMGIHRNHFSFSNFAIIKRAFTNTVDEKMVLVMDSQSSNGGLRQQINDPTNIFTGKRMEVLSATMDSHILPVAKAMNITNAILKLDMEGTECLAVQHAVDFFTEINVPYIYTEYGQARYGLSKHSCLESMFKVLRSFSYVPFKPDSIGLNGILDMKDYKTWPYQDIIWKKIL